LSQREGEVLAPVGREADLSAERIELLHGIPSSELVEAIVPCPGQLAGEPDAGEGADRPAGAGPGGSRRRSRRGGGRRPRRGGGGGPPGGPPRGPAVPRLAGPAPGGWGTAGPSEPLSPGPPGQSARQRDSPDRSPATARRGRWRSPR